jgi:ATP-dependent helicase HrpA
VDRFSAYFDGAPIIQVPGRLYPIETHFQPPAAETVPRREQQVTPPPPGDVLDVRLTGP